MEDSSKSRAFLDTLTTLESLDTLQACIPLVQEYSWEAYDVAFNLCFSSADVEDDIAYKHLSLFALMFIKEVSIKESYMILVEKMSAFRFKRGSSTAVRFTFYSVQLLVLRICTEAQIVKEKDNDININEDRRLPTNYSECLALGISTASELLRFYYPTKFNIKF